MRSSETNMANTFYQNYAQIVFSPKGRENLILPSFEERIYQYITGIIKNNDQKLIAINGMPDHIHVFIGFKPTIAIANLVRDIKANSSKFINEEHFLRGKFAWQDGYGCFTYAHSQLDVVAKYVMNQKEHHKTKTFREEYLSFLEKFAIPYDEKYLFDFYE
jgi:REP element-mobilizing transposase RayT